MMRIRYRFIEQTVLNLFKQFSFEKLCLPIDVNYLCSLIKNCKVWNYDKYSNFMGYTIDEVKEFLGSDSGCSLYDIKNNRYLILYNNYHYSKRNQWTIVHELAHILLNHFDILHVEQIAESGEYSFVEQEASYFVSLLLCPFPIIKALNIKSSTTIENMCDLSSPAAKICYNDFINTPEWAYKCAYSNDVKKLFSSYVNSKSQNNNVYINTKPITDDILL